MNIQIWAREGTNPSEEVGTQQIPIREDLLNRHPAIRAEVLRNLTIMFLRGEHSDGTPYKLEGLTIQHNKFNSNNTNITAKEE